jgi:hypothetical protein
MCSCQTNSAQNGLAADLANPVCLFTREPSKTTKIKKRASGSRPKWQYIIVYFVVTCANAELEFLIEDGVKMTH